MVASHQPLRKLAGLHLLVLALVTFASLPLQAQNAETLKRFETEKHTGSVEEALVGIEIINHAANGTVEVMHANGFVLRCDGFVLVPEGIFAGYMQNGQRAASHTCVFVLHPGTDHEQRLPFPPPISITDVMYLTIKLNNFHAPALRTLLTTAVKPGEPLQVYFNRWDAARGHFAPVEHMAATLGLVPKETIKPARGERLFGSTVPSIPAGAVVIGPEGMGIGLVSGSGAPRDASGFLGFEKLYLATNCISAVAASEAQFKAMKEERDNAEMLEIPGGPIYSEWMTKKVMEPELAGMTVSCLAPFQIDKDEVTNARYLKFWKALPPAQRMKRLANLYYPTGWADTDPPFPDSLADTPVLGVTFEAAQAYAEWAGKRLLTPCEWCLAALGPKGMSEPPDWTKKYMEDRNRVAAEVGKAHRDYVLSHPFMDADDFLPYSMLRGLIQCDNDPAKVHDYDVVYSWTAPWIARADGVSYFGVKDRWGFTPFLNFPQYKVGIEPDDGIGTVHYTPRRVNPQALEVAAWSKETVQKLTDPLFVRWHDPGYVLPVGSRDFDVSQYGVRDMLMNAEEIVMGSPQYLDSLRVNSPVKEIRTITMRLSWSHMGYTPKNATPDRVSDNSRASRQGSFVFGIGDLPQVRAKRQIVVSAYDTLLPISRLVGRTTDWPLSELILAQSNLQEVTSMLTVLKNVELIQDFGATKRTKDQPFDTLLFFQGPNLPVRLPDGGPRTERSAWPNASIYGAPIGLKMWVEQPRHPHQEIARPNPLSDANLPHSLQGTLYFVSPVGFRCAR